MTIDEKIKDLVLSSHFCCMDDAQMWADEASDFLRDNADALLSALADQRRYRFLKDRCENVGDDYGTGGQLYFGTYAAGKLDEAIDAELDQEGE